VIPEAPQLLDLERRSRREGSGLGPADLTGSWRLERIWSKGSQRPAGLSAALLRGLAARLQLAAADAAEPDAQRSCNGDLRISNSVRLGPLELRFEGTARLQGRRPLLLFGFERLLLRLAGRVLLERPLATPEPRRTPFFALIAAERPEPGGPGAPAGASGWLAARGRGGGIALWVRED